MSRDIQYLAAHTGNAHFYLLDSGEPRVAVQIPATIGCPIPFGAVGADFDDVVREVRQAREKYIKNRDHVPMFKGRNPKQ